MINNIFRWCVDVLVLAAGWLGLSYEAINVWVFVVIWPIVTLVLVGVVVWQQRQLRRLK